MKLIDLEKKKHPFFQEHESRVDMSKPLKLIHVLTGSRTRFTEVAKNTRIGNFNYCFPLPNELTRCKPKIPRKGGFLIKRLTWSSGTGITRDSWPRQLLDNRRSKVKRIGHMGLRQKTPQRRSGEFMALRR